MALEERSNVLAPGGLIQQRINAFLAKDNAALVKAARTANQVSKKSVRYRRAGRGTSQRPGRWSTGGKLATLIDWGLPNPDESAVVLNITKLDRRAKHWIIQEIGTGHHAVIRKGGKAHPQGRPSKGTAWSKTIKSQRGRRISSALVWATGPNGMYVRPGAATGQQLYLWKQIKGVPLRAPGKGAPDHLNRPGIRIRREIPPQQFIKKGSTEGFREYRSSVLAAARQQFRGGR